MSTKKTLSHPPQPSKRPVDRPAVAEQLPSGFPPSMLQPWEQTSQNTVIGAQLHLTLPGVDMELFQAEDMVLSGTATVEDLEDPRLQFAASWAMESAATPSVIRAEIRKVELTKLAKCVMPDFPKEIFAYSVPLKKSRKGTRAIDQITNHKDLRDKRLLFRGMKRRDFVTGIFASGFMGAQTAENEFAPATDNADIALMYAGSIGVVFIFDWTDGGGGKGLTTRILTGDAWTDTCKRWICLSTPNKPGPPHFTEDVLVGPMTANNSNVKSCAEPLPDASKQYVGKTTASFRAFAERHVGIV